MTSKIRIAVLANPKSGTFPVFWESIGPMFTGRAHVFTPQSFELLDMAILRLVALRPDIVFLCGGDGTQHHYLTRIVNRCRDHGFALPYFIILATGTMNDAATSLKLNRRSVPDQVERILGKLERGERLDAVRFRPMSVNGECAFLYGAGIPVAFLDRYYQNFIRGPVGSVVTIGSVLWSELFLELGLDDHSSWIPRLLSTFGIDYRNGWLRMLLDELGLEDAESWHAKDIEVRISNPDGYILGSDETFFRHTGVMATVIDQIGMGLRAFPEAMRDNNHFTLRTTKLSLAETLANGPMILTGQPVMGIDDEKLSSATVEFAEPTVRMVDGEIKPPALRDELGMGPELKIITG